MNGPHCIEAQECRGDFWLKLQEAVHQCGGGISIERLKEMKLSEIVDLLAQNGIRMTFQEEWHIDSIGKQLQKK